MKSIKEWAILNKMMLNLGKTKEIVFHRPHPRKFSLTPKLTNIEQVSSAKLLGVYFTGLVQREGAWAGCGLTSPLLAVPNVTAHPSAASVPTSYYSM